MLYEIEILEVRRIADLASAARNGRDRMLKPIAETELGESPPARGEHHVTGSFGFAAIPEDDAAYRALREAVEGLPPDIRRKIWAVMRIGCGDYAPGDWDRAMAVVEAMFEENIVSELAEEVDLHEKLMKGLYEIGAALPPA